MRILLIEDSLQLAEAIREFFRINGIQVDICGDGRKGYEQAQRERYDAMILDLMLPSMSGFDILAKLREAGVDTPTIILSAKTQMDDKLRGFNTGADDYLGKPFDMKELLARVNAIARRQSGAEKDVLEFNDISLDKSTHELVSGSQRITLSPREYEIMRNLIEKKGGLVGKELLDERVWGYSGPNMYNGVEVYVSFLRKKLRAMGVHTEIKVLRGAGYRLNAIEDGASDAGQEKKD